MADDRFLTNGLVGLDISLAVCYFVMAYVLMRTVWKRGTHLSHFMTNLYGIGHIISGAFFIAAASSMYWPTYPAVFIVKFLAMIGTSCTALLMCTPNGHAYLDLPWFRIKAERR